MLFDHEFGIAIKTYCCRLRRISKVGEEKRTPSLLSAKRQDHSGPAQKAYGIIVHWEFEALN